MRAFKLVRLRKDGTIAPLFINAKMNVPLGECLIAECYPTKGFAVRQGWHCTLKPYAPHLKERLSSGEQRVWVEVEIEDVTYYDRPESQGGTWVLAQKMKVIKIMGDGYKIVA